MILGRSHRILVEKVSTGVASKDIGRISARMNQIHFRKQLFFCFNDTYFLQIKGAAMGTKFAPIYATLILGYLEETLYRKVEDVFDLNFKTYIEENFKRFLDDCFILFRKSDEDLIKLHELINTLHPSLTFTMDKSRTKLSFLDTMVINNNGEVLTDIFYKPTDSKQYLLYTSCHPKHTRNSIPYNLARRIKTIVSDERTLHKRLEELEEFLIKRKYQLSLTEDAFQKAKSLDRSKLLNTKDTTEGTNITPYVTTFNH